MGFRCFGGRSSSRLRNGYVENALWGGEVGWGECRDGHASAHRPHWAAQAPAHHVPRTSGRERMEMCANGHRFWPAVATAAASSACWQHACQQGAQRVGRRPVWPGEGWQHGSGRPREQVIPPLRAATLAPWHARDHQPWLHWLLLPIIRCNDILKKGSNKPCSFLCPHFRALISVPLFT